MIRNGQNKLRYTGNSLFVLDLTTFTRVCIIRWHLFRNVNYILFEIVAFCIISIKGDEHDKYILFDDESINGQVN